MSKLFFILNGLTRGYPTIIIFATILFSIIQLNKQNFVFGICLASSDIINHILKEYVAKPLMKNNKIPILGVCRGMQVINFFYKGKQTKIKNHI